MRRLAMVVVVAAACGKSAPTPTAVGTLIVDPLPSLGGDSDGIRDAERTLIVAEVRHAYPDAEAQAIPDSRIVAVRVALADRARAIAECNDITQWIRARYPDVHELDACAPPRPAL